MLPRGRRLGYARIPVEVRPMYNRKVLHGARRTSVALPTAGASKTGPRLARCGHIFRKFPQ